MRRILIVAQETGGIGKSTIVRGVAEAVQRVAIVEIESSHRLTEFTRSDKLEADKVRYFGVRASREEIESSGGQAARREFDAVIDILYTVPGPTLVDVGANSAASLLGLLPDHVEPLREAGIELGLLVVLSSEASSLAHGASLLEGAKGWARARFVVANDVRSPIEPATVQALADDAAITRLRRFDFETITSTLLEGGGLRRIPKIDRAATAKEYGPAAAARIIKDLTFFRLAVMEAVTPAALWLVDAQS